MPWLVKLQRCEPNEEMITDEEPNSIGENGERPGAEQISMHNISVGIVGIDKICISCNASDPENIHPLFEGGACSSCYIRLKETMFANGEGDINYCCVCGESTSNPLVCQSQECSRLYCETCVDNLCQKGAYDCIEKTSDWKCFLCETSPYQGLLQKRNGWKENVENMFSSGTHIERVIPIPKIKKSIRVLSLFDGIGTGIFCLKKLGLMIEKYYASEIDTDALNVSRINHGMEICHIGPVENIDEKLLNKLGPIDLLIGGSPCNDLSLANSTRRGLYDINGTGVLFFHFCRIKSLLQQINSNILLFMFENTAAMVNEYRSVITRFLEVDPVLVDAIHFSPQKRARLFWGNIPDMNIANRTSKDHPLNDSLGNYITPNCDRTPLVRKIRTLTTKSNSLLQGAYRVAPILMNGKEDTLWITEVEEVFGFPRHYTDVGNLSLTKRLQLLGKSWSVPVVCHILKPLLHFFKTRE